MRRMILFILIGLMSISGTAFGQEIYRWVDEKGTVHFADDLSLVPEKYQDQVQKKKPPKEPSPTPSTGELTRPTTDTQTPPAPERKDLLGRGEEWWRARAKEWNEKLLNAQKNYETAYTAWKKKERELEESKFKPDSLKRKLKAELKVLEENLKDREKQVEEARNMVERVLPKQAEDYRADPDWLKIEAKK